MTAASARLKGARSPIAQVLAWYFIEVFGRFEGPGILPFYCDPQRSGHFAVSGAELATGEEAALFRLFIAFSMFQARRDTVILAQQRLMPAKLTDALASASVLGARIAANPCSALASANVFADSCSVGKVDESVDCGLQPSAPCQVKDATVAFKRMGAMGKLPTSAWLHLREQGGFTGLLRAVLQEESAPARRAEVLVERLAVVERVGRKLATMFVSALSTPSLAPGLTPWFPAVDGNALVIVDTNVARAVDALRGAGAPRTYSAREVWLREAARELDLRAHSPDVPSYSPRLVQQALYAFCSRSNRIARSDPCAEGPAPCERCEPSLCPFSPAMDGDAPRQE